MTLALRSLVNTAYHATAARYTLDRETIPSRHESSNKFMTSDIAELQTNCNDTKLLDRITDHWDHLVNEAVAQSPY
jgi:hypothetical protein